MRVICLTSCLFIFLLGTSFTAETEKPNMIILFCDDLGYGDLSSYGHPTIITPHIDKMAAEGMKLTQFYSASPVCSPSRGSLLTGRYPVNHGVTRVLFPTNPGGLAPEEITIAERLKELGYQTACIGKWHLGHKEGYLPVSQGFDSYFGVPYSNDMTIDPALKLSENIVLRKGMTKEMILNINALEIENKNHMTPLMENDEVVEFPADQATLTKRYTEKAMDFIRGNKDHPFFLYLPYTMPHIPLFTSEDFQDVSLRGIYGDVVEEIDWSVGQILNLLKQLNIEDNTIVLFTSDNGPWLTVGRAGGSSGLLHEGKFTTWEGGVREPAIFWWPGKIPAASVSSQLASTLDLFPTLINLAGGDFDDIDLDGYDISPLLLGSGESPRNHMSYYRDETLYAYREDAWKIHFYTNSPVENKWQGEKHDPPLLFNIDEDPSEQYNLNKRHPEILQEMIRKAEKYRIGPEAIDVTFKVIDATLGNAKIMIKGSMLKDRTAINMHDDGTNGDRTAGDHIWTRTITGIPVNAEYEWDLVEDDGSSQGINLIKGDKPLFTVDRDGYLSGTTEFLLQGPGPAKVHITFTVTDKTESINRIMIKGTMYENWTAVDMYDDGTYDDVTAGDHIWTRTITDIPIGAKHNWGCSDEGGSEGSVWLIKGRSPSFTIGADGKVTGDTDYIIKADNK